MKLNSKQFKQRLPYWTEFIKAIWLHYFDKKIFDLNYVTLDGIKYHRFVHSYFLNPDNQVKSVSITFIDDVSFGTQLDFFVGFIGSLNSKQLDSFYNTIIDEYYCQLNVLTDISPYLHRVIGDYRASILDGKLSSDLIRDDLLF